MSYPRSRGKGERPAVGSPPEVGGADKSGTGPQSYDGRALMNRGTLPESPFVEYWKTPGKVLRHYGGND